MKAPAANHVIIIGALKLHEPGPGRQSFARLSPDIHPADTSRILLSGQVRLWLPFVSPSAARAFSRHTNFSSSRLYCERLIGPAPARDWARPDEILRGSAEPANSRYIAPKCVRESSHNRLSVEHVYGSAFIQRKIDESRKRQALGDFCYSLPKLGSLIVGLCPDLLNVASFQDSILDNHATAHDRMSWGVAPQGNNR